MIAADYERHLREPSRKVKQDVEREWVDKHKRLEEKMRIKSAYALRLDENCRLLTEENKVLAARCNDAETKLHAVFQWITTTLESEEEGEYDDVPTLTSVPFPNAARESLDADFGPKVSRLGKLSMSMRGSNRDLQSEFSKFRGSLGGVGSLGPAPPRGGGLFRDDSVPTLLAPVDDDDDVF
jgi:centromeric protein E